MKKQWISIKRGLIRDPKHRFAMGECVWLYEYMIDIADWNTGRIPDWKDEAASDDMQMQIRTLREQRRKLESLDYISCTQKQYGQEIAILNWSNPREYSGEIYNPKQGGSKTPPSENPQGDTQGDTQGSSQDVTPTSNPNTKNHGTYVPNGIEAKIFAGLPVEESDLQSSLTFDPQRAIDTANLIGNKQAGADGLALAFQEARKINLPSDPSKIIAQRKAAREMLEMHVKPQHVREAVRQLLEKNMTVTDLYSVSKTAISLANPANAQPSTEVTYDPDGAPESW